MWIISLYELCFLRGAISSLEKKMFPCSHILLFHAPKHLLKPSTTSPRIHLWYLLSINFQKAKKNPIKKYVFCKKNYVKFQNPKNFAVILESDLVRIQGFSNTGQNGIQEHWREYWNTRYWKLDEIILEFQDWIEYCNTEIGLNENFKKCFCIKAHYSVKNPVQNTNFSIPNTKYIIPNNSDMYEVCITLNGDDAWEKAKRHIFDLMKDSFWVLGKPSSTKSDVFLHIV